MTRPGWLVHAEQEARDEAERNGWDEDYLPDRDERGPHVPPAEHHCDGTYMMCAALAKSIQRDRERRAG